MIVIININQERLIMMCQTELVSDYINQHIGSRTPLHDATLFQGHGNSQAQDLQSGVLERKVYHNVLMNTKSEVDFDCLLQLLMLDKTEEDNDMS
jgi:hypothetical protein